MRNYLSETRNMVKERKYDEALKRYIWYHELAIDDLNSAKEIQNQALNVLDDERLKHAIPDNIK